MTCFGFWTQAFFCISHFQNRENRRELSVKRDGQFIIPSGQDMDSQYLQEKEQRKFPQEEINSIRTNAISEIVPQSLIHMCCEHSKIKSARATP